MNSQDLYNLQEAYIGVYTDLDEERAEGVKEYQPRKRNPLPKEKPLSGEKGDGSGYGADKKFTQDTDAKSFKPGVDVPKVKQFGRISRIIPHGIGDHANKTQSRVSTIVRKDPGAPTSQKLPPQEKKKASKEIVRKTKNEEVDIYDIILSHLLDEGYADTYESAEAIMVNMSEDWRESIVEGLVDTGALVAGTVVGTAQRAAREIPKYVQQKVNNVAGTYERARQRADANAPSGGMTTKARSGEFSHGNQGGKPAATMKNPGPNFGRG